MTEEEARGEDRWRELRELDWRLAVAFGWTEVHWSKVKAWLGKKPDGNREWHHVPFYSTDPAANREVREEMVRRGWEFTFSSYREYGTSVYQAVFHGKEEEVGYSYCSDILEEAVVRAALAALEGEGSDG